MDFENRQRVAVCCMWLEANIWKQKGQSAILMDWLLVESGNLMEIGTVILIQA